MDTKWRFALVRNHGMGIFSSVVSVLGGPARDLVEALGKTSEDEQRDRFQRDVELTVTARFSAM